MLRDMIHPTAIISPQAKLHPTVQVGPYAIIDEGVELGANCVVGPHVYLTGLLTVGTGNRFHTGCIIGDSPQDLKYDGTPTRVRIGDNNVFREHVTVHRATKPDGETVIGSNNLVMTNVHIGHNSHVHDHVILASGVLLAGHVTVFDRAFLSGNAAVHQFVRVGTLAMMQGLSGVTQDLPPFAVSRAMNEMCGLNIVGMRRAGINAADRLEVKKLYRELFRSGKNLRAAVTEAQGKFTGEPAKTMLDFVATAKRGVVADCSGGSDSTDENE
jgi:UDP-N-acetylglucosamine acyltransferase